MKVILVFLVITSSSSQKVITKDQRLFLVHMISVYTLGLKWSAFDLALEGTYWWPINGGTTFGGEGDNSTLFKIPKSLVQLKKIRYMGAPLSDRFISWILDFPV